MGALLFPLRKYAATKYYQAQTDIGAHNLALHFDLQKMALLGKRAVFHSKSAFTVEDGFEWLRVDVDVIEPMKGCKKGELVQTAMLSIQGGTNQPGMIYLMNQPGMIAPQKGEAFLFFLLPTPVTNLFASLTAPYDDDLATLHLDGTNGFPNYRQGKFDTNSAYYERSVLIRSLLTESGQISPKGAELVRKKYARQIRKSSKKELIYLEWEKVTNPSGWSTDVPKGFLSQTNRKGH